MAFETTEKSLPKILSLVNSYKLTHSWFSPCFTHYCIFFFFWSLFSPQTLSVYKGPKEWSSDFISLSTLITCIKCHLESNKFQMYTPELQLLLWTPHPYIYNRKRHSKLCRPRAELLISQSTSTTSTSDSFPLLLSNNSNLWVDQAKWVDTNHLWHFFFLCISYPIYFQFCHYTFDVYIEYDHFPSIPQPPSWAKLLNKCSLTSLPASILASTSQSSLHTEATLILIKPRSSRHSSAQNPSAPAPFLLGSCPSHPGLLAISVIFSTCSVLRPFHLLFALSKLKLPPDYLSGPSLTSFRTLLRCLFRREVFHDHHTSTIVGDTPSPYTHIQSLSPCSASFSW